VANTRRREKSDERQKKNANKKTNINKYSRKKIKDDLNTYDLKKEDEWYEWQEFNELS